MSDEYIESVLEAEFVEWVLSVWDDLWCDIECVECNC
jgi:hypothetical protein